MTDYPIQPRLKPDATGYVCDECGREWNVGEISGCEPCAKAVVGSQELSAPVVAVQSGYDLICAAANAIAKMDLLGRDGTAWVTDAEVFAMAEVLHTLAILPVVPAQSVVTAERIELRMQDVRQVFPDNGNDPLKMWQGLANAQPCIQALRDLIAFADFAEQRMADDINTETDDPMFTFPQVGMVRGPIWNAAREALAQFDAA